MTLMIIGVIASMTIPTLKKNTQGREYAAKLKKTYSVLAQATDLVESNYAPMTVWKGSEVEAEYDKYLSAIKKCPPSTGCFYTDYIKMASGRDDYKYTDKGWVLADGISVTPRWSSTESPESYGLAPGTKYRGAFYVDVNGLAPPNQWGVDVFLLLLVPNEGLVPSGAYSYDSCKSVYGCAAKTIAEGKIDF